MIVTLEYVPASSQWITELFVAQVDKNNYWKVSTSDAPLVPRLHGQPGEWILSDKIVQVSHHIEIHSPVKNEG
jgi:hypothetical protein